MPRKCNKCNSLNPDSAHFCATCGSKLDNYSDWKLYDAFFNKVISNSDFRRYKELESAAKIPLYSKLWDATISHVEKYVEWYLYLLGGFFLIFSYFLFPKSCSNTKQIQRVRVEKKYGVGYDENHLLLEAKYDSISEKHYGNQWVLYDNVNKLYGVAYVTDSVTRIIEPTYTSNIIASNGLAVHETEEDVNFVSYNCIIRNKEAYKKVIWPGVLLSYAQTLVATNQDGKMLLLDAQGQPINNKLYHNILIDQDSIIRAIYRNGSEYTTELFDYSGKNTCDKVFYGVYKFSDGVAWSTVTKLDEKSYKYSIIDHQGNVLFTIPEKRNRVVNFNEGIGFYASAKGQIWHAINKKGNVLFDIQAYSVAPVTLGLIPVFKGTSYSDKKLGFVDKTGKTIIPYLYKAYYNEPKFDKDSLILVSFNGVNGVLHKNGVFTPSIK